MPPNSLVLIEAHITGPDNFTKAAEASNAEKLLVIQDAVMAAK